MPLSRETRVGRSAAIIASTFRKPERLRGIVTVRLVPQSIDDAGPPAFGPRQCLTAGMASPKISESARFIAAQ